MKRDTSVRCSSLVGALEPAKSSAHEEDSTTIESTIHLEIVNLTRLIKEEILEDPKGNRVTPFPPSLGWSITGRDSCTHTASVAGTSSSTAPFLPPARVPLSIDSAVFEIYYLALPRKKHAFSTLCQR